MKTEDEIDSVCIAKLSLKSICRTCLNSNTDDHQLISIFDSDTISSIKIIDQLSFLNLKIAKNDGYPNYICSTCMGQLDAIENFRKQCEKNQVILEQYLKIAKITETTDDLDTSHKKLKEKRINSFHGCLGSDHSSNCEYESDDLYKDVPKKESNLTRPAFDNTSGSHLWTHSVSDAFFCSQCDLSFNCISYLIKHNKSNHSAGDHICQTCGKSFSTTSKYEYHLKTHTREQRYACRHCDKSFIQQNTWKDHELAHNTERSYLCDICGKSFRHECSLKIHLKKHEGARKHTCNVCNKRFIQKANLKLHLDRHNNVKAFQCEQCGKKFTQRGNLMRHLILHNAEKLHSCKFCEESFLRIRDLRRHNLTKHGKTDMSLKIERSLQEHGDMISQSGENKFAPAKMPMDDPYSCGLCNRTFKVPLSLAKHMKVHSEERKFVCKECGNTFKKSVNLKLHIDMVHLKRKSYICEVCKKSFARVGDRNVHMRSHVDDKSHECTFCGRGFNLAKALRAHVRQHTGERPFVCIICNAGFTCHKTLVSHTRRQHSKEPQVMSKVDELVQTVWFAPSVFAEDGTTGK